MGAYERDREILSAKAAGANQKANEGGTDALVRLAPSPEAGIDGMGEGQFLSRSNLTSILSPAGTFTVRRTVP